WRRGPEADLLDILLPEGDDYKLVFISSDSSSKEEDIDDNDSSSTASSFPIDECDWDYFEPGPGARPVLNWNSPFGSPRVYRRSAVESPIGSPIVYRRTRESDTGTDEDNIRLDSGSPASSDSLFQARVNDEALEQLRNEKVMEEAALQCVHADASDIPQRPPCQSCGAPTQYIPIPVPVPIPFPVPTLWTPQDSVMLYGPQSLDQSAVSRWRVLPRNLWPYVSQAALIWPLINTGELGPLHSVLHNNNSECGASTDTTMPVATDRDRAANVSQLTTTATSTNNKSTSEESCENKENKTEECSNNNPPLVDEGEEITGYLECENCYISSTDASGDSSDSCDTSDNTHRKPRVRRVYNVNGGDGRQSDDALPSSNVTSDCDEEDGRLSHSSVREDDMSSSGSADTDSDDTGTVADQKPKRFSRIFVVNKNISSSSNASTSSSDTDTSDNDTDTEMDCTVILTNIKPIDTEKIDENCSSSVSNLADNLDNVNIDNEKSKEITDSVSVDSLKDKTDNAGANKILDCDKLNGDKINKIDSVNNDIRIELSNVLTEPTNKGIIVNKVSGKHFKESEYMSSSPGLSDVSAESLNSSDVEQVRGYNDEIHSNTEDAGERLSKNSNSGETSFLSEASRETQDGYTSTAGSEWNASAEIRSTEPVNVEGESMNTRGDGEQAGVLVTGESDVCLSRNAARYTSLVMITQEPAPNYQQVSVVTSDTTTLMPDNDVVVRHTNWQSESRRKNEQYSDRYVTVAKNADTLLLSDNPNQLGENVTVITGGETLSAFEEGLADDDSWVENLSHDDEDEFATNSPTDDSSSGEEVTLTCSAAIDREDELRGYHRTAIDFTLHTIVEESCEESEVEQNASKKKERPASATDLEKYFFFGLGDGTVPSINSNREDAFSETSSIYSEGMESLGGLEEIQQQNDNSDPAELASSRLEKYFLSGFMGFTAERRDSDGSVGSDSEGRPSPEQRRKKLVRARGTGRSHSSSLDNLDNAGNDQTTETQINSEDSSSSDSDTYDEINTFEKSDGQFDTIKQTTQEVDEKENDSNEDEDGHKTPQPEILPLSSNLITNKNQQSRDSGFIGSCDDLLKEQRDNNTPELPVNKNELKIELENIIEEKKCDEKVAPLSTPPCHVIDTKRQL
ncbi:hypothetical protein NQ314_016391, partial [Rhamnusium bicolor]